MTKNEERKKKKTATFGDMKLRLFECPTRRTCDAETFDGARGNGRFSVWGSTNVMGF
jgi:hypothetical protein